MRRAVIALIFLAFCIAEGQDSLGTYRIGEGVSAPKIISRSEPQYSEEARKARLEGKVPIVLVVGDDGTPLDVRVSKPLGFGLDEEAVEKVRAWRFSPGQKAGNPVAVATTIEVNFRLVGVKQWHLARAIFNLPAGATRPTLIKSEFPPDSSSQEPHSVTLTFDVDEHGSVINIHVENSSDAGSEREAIAAAREWRFNPGIKDGIPIVVPLTLEFARGVEGVGAVGRSN
jgi:TonB family protein